MKTQFSKFITSAPLLVGAAALTLLVGCASGNYQKGASAGKDLQVAADKINQGSAQVDSTLTALTNLVKNPGDLAAQFKRFSSEVSALQSSAKDVSSRFASMDKMGDAYFAEWDKQIALIQNEEIKSRSADRKAEVQKKFAAIKQSYHDTADEFKPFMSDLKDIQTALATDLTPGGVSAIKKVTEKAAKSGNSVKSSLGKLATQFKELGVAMSAAAPQPAAK